MNAKKLWNQVRGTISNADCATRRATRSLFGSVRRRFTRERLGRLSWYAALAGILAALAVASWGYRNRLNAAREVPAPMAVMAAATPVPTEAPTPCPPTFLWPVEGEIIGDFSPDAPVWSETLGQWQTHAGLDISAALGESVRACADGVVEDLWEDALWGRVIVLRHENGMRSTYANLETLNLVGVGDLVEAGQIISTVGRTASCEGQMADHMHFEVNREGTPIDFRKIVTENDM